MAELEDKKFSQQEEKENISCEENNSGPQIKRPNITFLPSMPGFGTSCTIDLNNPNMVSNVEYFPNPFEPVLLDPSNFESAEAYEKYKKAKQRKHERFRLWESVQKSENVEGYRGDKPLEEILKDLGETNTDNKKVGGGAKKKKSKKGNNARSQ